jgi:hypothetical protein
MEDIKEVQKGNMEDDIEGESVKVKRNYSESTWRNTKSKMRYNLRK